MISQKKFQDFEKVLKSAEAIDVKENTLIAKEFMSGKHYKVLELLLKDQSREIHMKEQKKIGKNIKQSDAPTHIIWATDNYLKHGEKFGFGKNITINQISGRNGLVIRPRIKKSKIEQRKRSIEKAEVFTSSWICNSQNNLIDNAWFGIENVFNTEKDGIWIVNKEKIKFPPKKGKSRKDYVNSKRLEISCGEAPYIVNRYDVVTGKIIDVNERVGFLDRKIRVINENAKDDKEWIKRVIKAFQNSYGYERQGDSLLIARENVFYSFLDYYVNRFGILPEKKLMFKIANIISWNIWQMDGLTGYLPRQEKLIHDLFGGHYEPQGDEIECKIRDWSKNQIITFNSLHNNTNE